MALNNFITFPIDYEPTETGNIWDYRYPDDVKWIGGTDGAQKGSVTVDNGGDASTDTNGTGFGVGGSPFVNSRNDGSLKVDRYGQKDGRVLVRIGHDTAGSSGTNFDSDIKGMHLNGVVGVAFKYSNSDADSNYSAMVNRIMIQYAYKSGSYYNRRVYDATVAGTGTEKLRTHLGNGDKFYCFFIPTSEETLVLDNKMTCEGVYLEFKANKSPGCCKNKHITAQVWGLTPIIRSKKGSTLLTSPSFIHVPVAYDTQVKDAMAGSGLMELATE